MAEQVVTVTGVSTKSGSGAKGPWTMYLAETAGGSKFQTFNDSEGAKLQAATGGSPVKITYHEETRGKYTNNVVDAVSVATGPVTETATAPRSSQDEFRRSKEEVRRTEAFGIAAAIVASFDPEDKNLESLIALGDAIAEELASTGQVPAEADADADTRY